jgi:ABC-type Fe3+/spermidine/putrescine transport system ATPase subunit
MSFIEVHNVSKSFESTPVIRDISFNLEKGSILCLLGPSGCGKTTLLRIIAGLETPDAGRVLCEGQDLKGVPSHHRRFGLMFQDFALFPHKDVLGNVAFGLRMQGLPSAQIQVRVTEMLELVGLVGFGRRDVNELSGGEQQRVALARSLVPNPRLLMLDEPLGSLDRALRERLMNELRAILKSVGVTTIYVTHDQQEAFAIADRIIVMDKGRKVQEDAPEGLYRHPATPFVARFLGMTNLLAGTVVSSEAGLVVVETSLGRLHVETENLVPSEISWPATVLIRPEAAEWEEESNHTQAPNLIEGQVRECSFRGDRCHLVVRHARAGDLTFSLRGGDRVPAPASPIRLTLRPQALTLLRNQQKPS